MDNWIYFNTFLASFNEINIRPLPDTFTELFITNSTYRGSDGFDIRFLIPRAIIPNVSGSDQALVLIDTEIGITNILRIWSGGLILGSELTGYQYYDVYYR